jgi:heme/copper-type cytochrome/quinol oxidase subunit 4
MGNEKFCAKEKAQRMSYEHKLLAATHALVFFALCFVAIYTNGLGGGGDSITHYFISKLSWRQPEFFLDLWGKPVFTFLSSPFAQIGFTGIKIFNVCCAVAASYFTCLTARELGKKWHWLILPLAFIAPAYYTYIFSGLTEPLAGLLSIMAVWLCLSGRVSWGFIVASLLPFARTEAQVFLLFFLAFGLLNQHYKKLPLLASGYLFFSFIGGFVFGDFLWVFSSPYNSQGSVYGNGEWFHYINSLKGMLAIPGFILAALGIIRFFQQWLAGRINWRLEPWLVHGIFFSLFVGHSLVWALGIYGSAGLERTLLTAFPFLWIIMLDGVLLLRSLLRRMNPKMTWALPLVLLMIQAYFTWNNPLSRYYWNTHLTPGAEYEFFKEHVAAYIKSNYPETEQFVMDKPEMAIALNTNFKNDANRQAWSSYHNYDDLKEETIWIYDSYYVPVQYGITLETIINDKKLKEIKRFESEEGWLYIIFVRA